MGKKKSKKKNVLSFNHPDLKNSFNTLLANIRFASIDKPIRTIAITSVGMDEGKSTVASNLALAIANSGLTCALVDTDFRKHSLSKMLNVNSSYGLHSLLSGVCSIYDAITQTTIPNLFFIDCEPEVPNPADILSSARFTKFIEYLYNNFDYVVFDTPPLISFVDAALISSLVDATLLVVREGEAKKTQITNAVTQLKQAKAHILGTVLTFSTDTTESEYYYAYYNKEGKRVKKNNKHDINHNNNVNEYDINNNLSSWMNDGYQETPPNQDININQNLQNQYIDQSEDIFDENGFVNEVY